MILWSPNPYKKKTGLCGVCCKSRNKNKTYLEIYGTSTPKCGYQRGAANIAKRADIRKKISEGVKKSYTPELRQLRRNAVSKNLFSNWSNFGRIKHTDGEWYRSKLEIKFAELLKKHDIPYKREVKFEMLDGYCKKFVDFVIDDNILVEVTGYAFKEWQETFDLKIRALRASVPLSTFILVFTYNKKFDLLFGKHFGNINFFIEDIENEDRILAKIFFARLLNSTNKKFKKIYYAN